ncbi:MAG: glutamate-5-semialdehyde dehydrogenase [Candidatus Latescibacteria bacterium]|jgi:glutamate-5-semialdehyde dehydrogenase|nr:glutamate-5-semialdehyde dehydrogenase [Candidatus Latescibacterota bacterium]MDP7448678.1 glutamate-5-semialdehyde dehydrogenase [Candidatus Latescibacterota bacterium]HJP30173.1 glutamate-5-semialdehyde dehydrogenase [Candidatus Latescibacterota bacterium]
MSTATVSIDTGPDLRASALAARESARSLAATSGDVRDAGLEAIAVALESEREEMLAANAEDLGEAQEMAARGDLGEPLVARLNLAKGKYDRAIEMVRSVKSAADPLWQTQRATEIDGGLNLFRVSVPIGVLGVIFESRPDALIQIAAVCLKSGNAVLMKGGSEAARSNRALADLIVRATASVQGLPANWLTLMETREDVKQMLAQEDAIDLIIPRGSNEFVSYIMDNTNIPVTGHADGICHVYVDKAADLDKAVRVAVDSKVQDVSTCCTAETLLVHADVAEAFLGRAVAELVDEQVEVRGDERTRAIAGEQVVAATEQDWSTEYLDYILSVKVVDSLAEAMAHINRYGSAHTDTIVTEDRARAVRFLQGVDGCSALVNASTRFADGYRYGLGAEVGISTGRLHSRGPVGMEGLTTYKYLLEGDGHTVDDYEGSTPKPYTHRNLADLWKA